MTSSSAMAYSLFDSVCQWDNLLLAHRKASKGKRGKAAAAAFESRLADRLLDLQAALVEGRYAPGNYTHFQIHEPKHRRISAAPFRDRVVHHALCNVIEPLFEPGFIAHSYANRTGKGTHQALDCCQRFARRYRYALRGDVVQFFAAIDHEILLARLAGRLKDERLTTLIERIVASGDRVLEQQYDMVWFPGDDLLAACRARGLPIGNLTSQFWANVYLDPFDHFVNRTLHCPAYLRYVDDFVLFADEPETLRRWREAAIEFLARLRLTLHEQSCQVTPTRCGIPWLGFVVYPDHRKLKARKALHATRRLRYRFRDWKSGAISFAEFDASVKGWVNHARHGDTWGLRREVLRRMRTAR